MTSDDWRQFANRATTNPDLFVLDKGESAVPAKKICAHCPVVAECLQYALDNNIRGGVYGGKTWLERRQIRRSAA